jgi:hypothetical protein
VSRKIPKPRIEIAMSRSYADNLSLDDKVAVEFEVGSRLCAMHRIGEVEWLLFVSDPAD